VTFDYELSLISKQYSKNAIGDLIETESVNKVLCGRKSVTRSEHYAAAANGLQPEVVFVVNRYEYAGQKEVEFEGKRYRVIRSYLNDKPADISECDNLELICQGAGE
jgi:SPP1 family predicted phage head-tail adaptor